MSYRVKTVTEMTGIPRATLLAWERRHDILEPRRSDSGYRFYTDDDVALLRELKALTDAGHPISEAVALARRESSTCAVSEPPPEPDPLRDALVEALLRYDRDALDRLVPELSQLPFARAIERIYLPMLAHTGAGWAAGRISIGQEHYVSAWVREQLVSILHALGAGPATGPVAMCATAPGERHELGVLAVAIELALAGWRVIWLGPDLPTSELAHAARATRPRLLAVSVMLRRPRAAVLDQARELRESVDRATWIVVGGRGTLGLEPESTDDLLFAPTLPHLRDRLAARGMASR